MGKPVENQPANEGRKRDDGLAGAALEVGNGVGDVAALHMAVDHERPRDGVSLGHSVEHLARGDEVTRASTLGDCEVEGEEAGSAAELGEKEVAVGLASEEGIQS